MAFDPTGATLDEELPRVGGLPKKKPADEKKPFDPSTAVLDSDADQGILGTLWQGAKSAARAVGATANTYGGNEYGVVEKAEAQQQAPKDYRLEQFYNTVERNTQASKAGLPEGEDVGVLDAIGNVASAAVENPAGAGLAVVEQLPNAMPAMAGGLAGFKAGGAAGAALGTALFPGVGTAVGGTAGAILGGLAGMFLGNTLMETGHKAMEAASDGSFTPEEMAQAKREGAVKAGVITAVDGATLGLGSLLSGSFARTTRSALESATRKALVDKGVDVTDQAAVLAARQSPEITSAVRTAQENALKATDTLKRRATEAGVVLGLETVGEGVGEYLGELAATGEANVTDAVMESLLSLGQSGAEAAWAIGRNRQSPELWEVANAQPGAQAQQSVANTVQPMPTPENPNPAPVERPDPATGPLSAAAALLPSPSAFDAQRSAQQGEQVGQPLRIGGLPGRRARTEQAAPMDPAEARIREAIADVERRARLSGGMTPTLAAERARLGGELVALQEQRNRRPLADQREQGFVVDAAGNVSPSRLNTPARENYVQGGRGMDQQAPTGRRRQEQPAIEGQVVQPAALADQRERGFVVDASGNAVPSRIGTPPHRNYVQGGRGMDQQAPAGQQSSAEAQAAAQGQAASTAPVAADRSMPAGTAADQPAGRGLPGARDAAKPAQAQASAPASPATSTAQASAAELPAAAGQAPAAQAAATEQPAADAPDIAAITRKQIPDMTDAEIEQAIAHYGPDHKRTAKLRKEQEKRAQAKQPAASQPAGDEPAARELKPKSLKEGIEKVRQQKAAATDSTAPEHATVGVDDRELEQIVSEFNEAHEAMRENGVHNLFAKPAKDEVVRLSDKVKVYHEQHGWMTPAEARKRIAEWKAHALAQGENDDSRNQNARKVVLSLFDKSGAWSRPWEEAGYQVYRFDIQIDPEAGDVHNFSVEFFGDWFGDFDGMDIYAILAACPCTDFASSGARHFAAKDKDGRTVASVRLVHQTLRTIEYFRPAVWAVENPVGRIEKLGGLPPWRLSFDPNHLGDPYTKKTLIWGRFNGDLPIAPVYPSEGSKMHSQFGGKSLATKNARSVTPEGFAYAFFMANNAIDNPLMAVANKYDRLDKQVLAEALEAGLTEDDISAVVDDYYYMDLDDDAAHEALREAIAERSAQGEDDTEAAVQTAQRPARRPQPGEEGYTLLDARNDLMEARAKVESQGMIRNARDVERVRRFEELVKQMEAEQAAAQQPAESPAMRVSKAVKELDEALRPHNFAQVEGSNAFTHTVEGDGRKATTSVRPTFDGEQVGFHVTSATTTLQDGRMKANAPAAEEHVGTLAEAVELATKWQGVNRDWVRQGERAPADLASVSAALQEDIERQKKRVLRLRNEARNAATMEQKRTRLERLDQAEQRLRQMRVRIFDAEDVAAEAIRVGSNGAWSVNGFDTLYRDATYALNEAIIANPPGYRPAQQRTSAPEPNQGEDLDAMFDDVLAEVTGTDTPAAEDLDAMFDDVLAEVTGESAPVTEPAASEDDPAAAPAKRTRSARAKQTKAAPAASQRSAGEALASAGKNLASALDDAINGLGALFGGHGRFGSGLTFDEETYAKAKPLFASAVVNLKNASADLREAMRAVVSMVVERFGADVAQRMKPYVVRFIEDVREGKVQLGAEDDTGRNAAGDAEPLASVPPQGVPEAGQGSAETSDGLRPSDPDGNGRFEEDRSGRGNRLDGSQDEVLPGSTAEAGPTAPGRLNPREDTPNTLAGENPGNFVITEDFGLGEGSAGRKIEANLAAIRTLRKIQQENRYATPDEQAVMARYVGWGGLKSVFDPKKADATDMYGRAQRELKQLLSKPEYDAAFDSVRNAHYTAKGVVDAMWRLVRHLGFNGGRVLEPTVGIGNFIGLQPADLAGSSEWHASELDATTGSMAKLLYPDANVLAGTGFQDAKFANGVFDLAIGNPPFGAVRITDRNKNRSHLNGMKVHNYIIAKTGMHLRPGGVMAMVVTHRFLDTADDEARSVLAKDFKFLGAIRLPNDAFRQNAGTDVVTDIIVLQKYRENEPREKSPAWLDVNGTIEVDGKPIRVNRYYEQHPHHILGRSAMDGTMYAGRRDENGEGEYTVHSDGRDLGQAIDELMTTSFAELAGVMEPSNQDREVMAAAMLQQSDLPVGGMRLSEDGRIERRDLDDAEGNAVIEVITPDTLWKDQAREWQAVRDAVVELRDTAKQRRLTPADFSDLIEQSRFAYKADGKPKSSPTKAEQALYTLVDAAQRPELFAWRFDGELAEIEASLQRKKLGQKDYDALRGMLDLRNRTLALIRAELADAKGLVLMRAALNKAYDEFVAKHGYLSAPANFNLLGGDVGAEAGLEVAYEPEVSLATAKALGIPPRKASAKKADILSQRVNFPRKEITSAASPEDALDISLSERGKVDLGYMSRLLGMPVNEVLDDLLNSENPRLFRDPETDEYVDAETYLSGNVRHKLEVARRHGLPANVRALEAVQPAPKAKHQIRPNIRGLWMPKEVFTDFLRAMGVRNPDVLVIHSQGMLKAIGTVGELTEFGAQFAHPDRSVIELFNAAASGKSITVLRSDGKQSWKDEEATKSANAIVARMAKVFEDFAYADEARVESIVNAFNERMNTHTPRVYNGEKYLRTVGASPSIKLRRTQKNGAWRMVLSKTMLADHVVGAGKTFTAIAGVMERRRLGLSRKPMIAVPNHLVVQWARDFYKMYPGAKVLAATPADFAKKNRRRLLARIATGDFDAVIVGHTSIGFIENFPADHQAIIQENIAALEEAMEQARQSGESKRTLTQMRDRLDKYRDKLTSLAERSTDEIGIDFKALGVDYLVVDEAHEFKNLEYATSGERVVGMNDPNGSKRAFDLYVKVRGLLARDGGVAFLTGTPVSNSLVEVFTMMRYLAHDELKLRQQEHFDAWSGAYAATDTRLEYTATQKLKPRRVLAGLNNLSALRQLYEHFADIITMADLKRIYAEEKAEQNRLTGSNERTEFPVPKVKGGKRALDSGDITEAQAEYMDYLVARMKRIESMKGRDAKDYARIDNALNVLTDARKMSLDIRVVDPSAPRDENGKVMRAARNIKATYDKWADVRGTQMVFCDLSTPAKTAGKAARALIKDTADMLFGKSQAAQVRRHLEGKSFVEQWDWLKAQADELVEDERLDQEKRDQIETYFAELEDAEATVLTADIGFSVYDDLRAVLVEMGIPESEIAFIHDYNTPEQKEKLFDRMNNGYIRVLMGSSAKMGAGTNAQKRLVALHHMDAPWRPSDVEQREGRIIRQGNLFYQAVDMQDANGLPPDIVAATKRLRGEFPNGFEVEIIAYSTNGTSDTVMWQILERKAAGIEQFRAGGLDSLEEEASDSDQYAEFMATSTGNPVFRHKLEAERAYTELEAEVSGTRIAKANAESFLRDLPRRLADAQEDIAAFDGKTVTVARYGSKQGSADEYQAAMREAMEEFDRRLAEWEEKKAVADAAVAAWEAAPEKTRGDKPSMPTRPTRPGMLSKAVQERSGYARAMAAALEAVRTDGPAVEVEVGDGMTVKLEGEKGFTGSNRYTAYLYSGSSYVTLEHTSLGKDSKASDSPNMIRALEPAAINRAIEDLVEARKGAIRSLEERRPKQEQLAAMTVDESKVQEAKELMEWYQRQVSFAEEHAEVERARRRNRYIPRDIRRFPGWSQDSQRVQEPQPSVVEVDGVEYRLTGYRSGIYSEAFRLSDDLPVILKANLNAKMEQTGYTVIEQPKQLRESADVRFSRRVRPSGATRAFIDRRAVVQLAIQTVGEAIVRDRFVFCRYDELPAHVREAAAEQGAKPHEVDAVFSHGKTYIVDDRFRTLDDARKAIFHEHYVHYGLRAKYGAGLGLQLARLLGGLGGLDGVRKLAREQGIDLSSYEEGILNNPKIPKAHQPLILTEELLAHIGETTGTLKRMLQEAIGAIRAWLRKNGWASLAEWGVTDIAYVLRQARRAALDEDSTPPDRPRLRITRRDEQTRSENFRRWFRDSKVVDKNGEPVVLYHGTAADFTIFEDRSGSATGHSTSALGYFMTSDRRSAEGYARNAADGMPGLARVMELYASIQNPYRATLEEMQAIESTVQARAFRAKLERAGYDGMYIPSAKAWVAFYNTQIKSATDNTGAFDEIDPDIRFRRSSGDDGSPIGQAISSITVQDVKRSARAKYIDFLSIGLQALGRRQLVDLYDGLLPLRRYDRLVERMGADINDMGAQADELARAWGKVKDSDKLAELMHDATLAQIDADPLVAAPLDADPAARQALNDRFTALSPEAQAIYRKVRDAYKEHNRHVHDAIRERIRRANMSDERKADLLRKMEGEWYWGIKGVYFPLARFGKYVVAVKDRDGKIASVHRAETMGEANNLRDQLLARFPVSAGYEVGKVTLDKEFVASRDSVGRGFMAELFGALEIMDLTSSQRAELEDTLGQLYLSSMPDLSWAKHGIHRKGTPGFSDDARRAFAQNMFHGARYLAKLRYGDRMQEELERMQKHADQRKQDPDFDQPKAQRVIDELVKRHEVLMNPKTNPLSTALTSFGFVYYLGLSPAAALVNLTQTALVAFPIMGAKWGFKKAAAALMTASNQALRGKNDITESLNAEELRAFQKAVKDGTIDVTQSHDLAAIAQGEDSKVMWKIRPVMRAASFLFHQAEVFNRQVTFIAAYRLAREAGASPTAAYEQAKKATYDGHYDYSAANRPRIMQGNVARVLLLFKQFAQNMIYTIARNAYLSVKGESPEVRKQARQVFGAIMALHASAAGVLGLPLVAPMLAIASALGGDDDEPWDAEVALRNLLADTLGQKPAEVIARGLSRLGPADISGRVSLDGLLLPDVAEGLEGRRLAEAWTTALLGPVAGVVTNAAVGANHIAEGRYAMGLESMLPVVVRNQIKALRYGSEGVVDSTGIVVRDEVSAAGIASQMFGFSPSEVRLSFEGKSAIYQADRRLAARRSELLAQFARAAMEGDQDGMAEARAAIRAFNEKNPTRRIQMNHMMQSVNARQRRIALAKDGVYLPSNRLDARAAGRFAAVDD